MLRYEASATDEADASVPYENWILKDLAKSRLTFSNTKKIAFQNIYKTSLI